MKVFEGEGGYYIQHKSSGYWQRKYTELAIDDPRTEKEEIISDLCGYILELEFKLKQLDLPLKAEK